MTDTPFVQAAFTGQTAGTDLANYVAQNGDVAATFSRESFSVVGSASLQFSSAGPLIVANPGSGNNDVHYAATTQATQDDIDITVNIKVASVPSGLSFGGFTFADDGTGANMYNVYWNPSSGSITLQSVGNGQSNTTNVNVPAVVVGNTYTMTGQIRGSGSSRTLTVLFGVQGNTLSTIVNAGSLAAYTSLTITGRNVGPRLVWASSNGTQSATTGSQLVNFTASNYSNVTVLTAGTLTAASAGTGSVTVTASGDTGGTAPYTRQFQIAPNASGSPGTWANAGSATSATTYTYTGLTVGSGYSVRYTLTDSENPAVTVTSNAIQITGPASNLAAGTLTAVTSGIGGVLLTAAGDTGGTTPYSRQFQIAPSVSGAPGTWANLGTAGTATTATDTGLTAGTTSFFRYELTDSESPAITVNSAAVSFTVPLPTFAVSTSPASLIVAQGSTASITVLLTATGGYTGTDALSVAGLPSGVTAAFSPATIVNGVGSSVLTLTATGAAVVGTSAVTVTGSDGVLTETAPVSLSVIAAAAGTTLDTLNSNVAALQATIAALSSRLQTRWF